jgi:hypothetical protein
MSKKIPYDFCVGDIIQIVGEKKNNQWIKIEFKQGGVLKYSCPQYGNKIITTDLNFGLWCNYEKINCNGMDSH